MALLKRYSKTYIKPNDGVEFYQKSHPEIINQFVQALESYRAEGITKVVIETADIDLLTFNMSTYIYSDVEGFDGQALITLLDRISADDSEFCALRLAMNGTNDSLGIIRLVTEDLLDPAEFPQYCS